MSSRSVIAFVITLALAIAVASWFLRDDHAAAHAVAPAPQLETPASPPAQIANTPNAAEKSAASTLATPREEVATPASVAVAPTTTEPVLGTVYGFVKPIQADEPGEVWLGFVDHLGKRERAQAGPDGAYSISGLALGSWWVSCGSSAASAKARIELDASEPNRRLDLTLSSSPEVRVKVTTPDGQPISGMWLFAVATREPPGVWIDEVRGSLNNTFGVGAWQGGMGGKPPAPPYIGSIVLDIEPPVYVSLMRYQRVLATVRVEERGRDAEFVFDPTSPMLADASLRARAVDPQGAPIAAAMVRLESNASRMSRPDPAQPGVVHFERLPPGNYELVIMQQDFADSRTRILLEPGATLDLGDIRMELGLSIDGTVVDEGGRPVESTLSCDAFDRATGRAVRTMVGRVYKTDANGHLHIAGLTRGEFLLALEDRESDFGRCAQMVDTRAGSVEGVHVVAARGVPLVVRPSGEEVATVRYTVRNADKVPVLSTRLWSVEPFAFKFAPGNYTVEVEMPNGVAPFVHKVVLADEPVELALP